MDTFFQMKHSVIPLRIFKVKVCENQRNLGLGLEAWFVTEEAFVSKEEVWAPSCGNIDWSEFDGCCFLAPDQDKWKWEGSGSVSFFSVLYNWESIRSVILTTGHEVWEMSSNSLQFNLWRKEGPYQYGQIRSEPGFMLAQNAKGFPKCLKAFGIRLYAVEHLTKTKNLNF